METLKIDEQFCVLDWSLLFGEVELMETEKVLATPP